MNDAAYFSLFYFPRIFYFKIKPEITLRYLRIAKLIFSPPPSHRPGRIFSTSGDEKKEVNVNEEGYFHVYDCGFSFYCFWLLKKPVGMDKIHQCFFNEDLNIKINKREKTKNTKEKFAFKNDKMS